MSNTITRFLGVVSCCLLFTFAASAQRSECRQKLNQAAEWYAQGKLSQIPGIIRECSRSGSYEERIEANRLLALTYLYLDQYDDAESCLERLLLLNPEYTLDPNDPAELKYLFDRYLVRPWLLLGFGGSLNLTPARVANDYQISANPNAYSGYRLGVGFSGNAKVGFPIFNRWEIMLEPALSLRNFTFLDSLENYATLTVRNTITSLELPAYVRFTYPLTPKILPYAYAGATGRLNLAVQGDLARNAVAGVGQDSENPIYDLGFLHTTTSTSLMGGLGVKYKLRLAYLTLDVRYERALTLATVPGERYTDKVLLYRFGYLADDYYLDNVSLQLGFVKPLYRIRKVERGADL